MGIGFLHETPFYRRDFTLELGVSAAFQDQVKGCHIWAQEVDTYSPAEPVTKPALGKTGRQEPTPAPSRSVLLKLPHAASECCPAAGRPAGAAGKSREGAGLGFAPQDWALSFSHPHSSPVSSGGWPRPTVALVSHTHRALGHQPWVTFTDFHFLLLWKDMPNNHQAE